VNRTNQARALTLAVLTLSVIACGGEDSPTGASADGPTTFPARSFSDLSPNGTTYGDYTVSANGTLQISADWQQSGNDIDIFITGTSCSTGSYNDLLGGTGNCRSMASQIGLSKPERLNHPVSSGSYRIWVASSFLSSTRESGTLNVTFSR
jgi:hypothetical protein